MNRPNARSKSHRPGFTLVELLVVIVILALLLALLIPAIGAAIKTAKTAAVAAEINQLASALADFKNKYGDYPPSRIILSETGMYDPSTLGSGALSNPSSTDITIGQLAQRSLTYLRKFFPRADFRADGTVPNIPVPGVAASASFYDFNNNGRNDGAYIIQGHECLVFFLGGIPSLSQDPSTGRTVYGMTGFSKNPQNPFLNDQFQPTRLQPMFEFASNRLDDTDFNPGANAPSGYLAQPNPLNSSDPTIGNQIPGYFEGSFKTNTYYAYFSAYSGAGYDPNDVNFFSNIGPNPQAEQDAVPVGPIALNFNLRFPNFLPNSTTVANPATSVSPNPYTTTLTTAASVQYQNPQSFQIISAGPDGQYGVGGYYSPNGTPALPVDPNNTLAGGSTTTVGSPTSDTEIRIREKDNITNFHNGRLD